MPELRDGPFYVKQPLEWQHVRNPDAPDQSMTFRHLSRPLVAIVSIDMGRWHMSVSHRDRVPSWEELGIARDALLPPDIHFCIAHPPRRYWLNYDRRVLHLWELRDQELTRQFEWEGAEARKDGANTPDGGGEDA